MSGNRTAVAAKKGFNKLSMLQFLKVRVMGEKKIPPARRKLRNEHAPTT